MPSNMLDTDVGFPKFTGTETPEEKINQILNYLFMLREQLQYSLSHIGTENFNDASLIQMQETITEPIQARLENDEGTISALQVTADQLSNVILAPDGAFSQLQQTVGGFRLVVQNADGTSSEIDIGGGTISLTGLVTFSDLSGSGTTTINGDNIVSGTITGTKLMSQEKDGIPTWLGDSHDIEIENGHIWLGTNLGQSGGTLYGDIKIENNGTNNVMAIRGYGGLLIDSDNLVISSNGRIDINGAEVYVNGNPL